MSVRGTWAIVAFSFLTWFLAEAAWFRARQSAVAPIVTRQDAPNAPSAHAASAEPLGQHASSAQATQAPNSGPALVASPETARLATVDKAMPAKAMPSEPGPGEPVPAQPPYAATKATPPKFDIVRVEPSGDTVVAGQGAPNATVDLLVSGKIVARATTDATGHFAMLPPALKPGASALTLQQGEGAAAVPSAQSIAVSVPEKAKGAVVVALAEPGQPTKILAAPRADPKPETTRSETIEGYRPLTKTPASRAETPVPASNSDAAKPAEPDPKALAIRSVELENGTGFFASGNAAQGTPVRVYLNDSPVATVVAGQDKSWSVKIMKGLAAGHYTVRADALAGGTRVTTRVEVPFDVPVAMAAATAAPVAPAAPTQATPSSVRIAPVRTTPVLTAPSPVQPPSVASAQSSATANAVVEEIRTTIVNSGDNLWDISRARLGEGRRYTRIYAANLRQIRDPKLIYPGQIFVLPTGGN